MTKNVDDYSAQVDDLLDEIATNPNVTADEYRDLLLDISFRCTAAARLRDVISATVES